MSHLLCVLALILAVLMIPCIFLGWATETRSQRIRRLSRQGLSQRAIADRLGVSRYRVRCALA